MVAVLPGGLGLGLRAFAVANLAMIVVWLLLARSILRERQTLVDESAGGAS